MSFPLDGSFRGLVGGQHLLRALGLDMDSVLNQLENVSSNLEGLADRFDGCSGGLSPAMLGGLLSGGGIPGAGFMPTPTPGGPGCGCFAPPQSFDLGGSRPGANFFERLGNRMQGAQLERFLQQNPFARQQVEMALGGRIVPDGINDGRIQVQPFPPGFFPGGAPNNAAMTAFQMLDNLSRSMMGGGGPQQAFNAGYAAGMGQGPGILQGAMLGALSALLGGGFPGMPGFAPPGGGSYMPGGPGSPGGPGGPYGGPAGGGGGPQGAGGGDDISALMNDPSLTVEDKVTLMLMAIMKKMDKEIEAQGKYIESIQAKGQQGAGGAGGGQGGGGAGGAGGGAGGAGGAGDGKGGGSNPSIDVETMKLKRLIDKRSQMFDTLRQIIDKYNETAKGVIQSIGR